MARQLSAAELQSLVDERYRRINVNEACMGTWRDSKWPPLDVWVRGRTGYDKLKADKVQSLWRAHKGTPAQSFCRFISRELLKLTAQEYEDVKRSMHSRESLMGIYKDQRRDIYMLVLEFPPHITTYNKLLVGGTVAGTLVSGALIAAGVARHRQAQRIIAGRDLEDGVTPYLQADPTSSEKSAEESESEAIETLELIVDHPKPKQEPDREEPQEEPKSDQEAEQDSAQQEDEPEQKVEQNDEQKDVPAQPEADKEQDRAQPEANEETERNREMLQFVSYLMQREAEAQSSGLKDSSDFVDSELHPADYDVDTCINAGVHEQTFWIIMELYYYKILPAELRDRAYMHRSPIEYNTLYQFRSRAFSGWHEYRQAFVRDFNNFLGGMPKDKTIGICTINIRMIDPIDEKMHAHVALLVFDATKKRLEYYDTNGRDELYYGASRKGPTESFYGYLVRNREQIHYNNPQVCTIWGSPDTLQLEKASCSLWVNVIAICRMSGIDREFLPTDFKDVREISIALRQTLLHACKFAVFTNGLIHFNFQNWSSALLACQVPEIQVTHIRNLVERQNLNEPKLITDDINVCQEIKEAQPQAEVDIADCGQITVDTYRGPINKSNVERCDIIGSITFKGNPRSFPVDWFDKTDLIIFEPRSGLVSLNTDLIDVFKAIKTRDDLQIRSLFGFVNLTEDSILDTPGDALINFGFGLVIIHGDLPPNFAKKLKTLASISTPVLLLSPYDAPDSLALKMSSPVLREVNHFAVYKESPTKLYVEQLTPWVQGKDRIQNTQLDNMSLALYRVPK